MEKSLTLNELNRTDNETILDQPTNSYSKFKKLNKLEKTTPSQLSCFSNQSGEMLNRNIDPFNDEYLPLCDPSEFSLSEISSTNQFLPLTTTVSSIPTSFYESKTEQPKIDDRKHFSVTSDNSPIPYPTITNHSIPMNSMVPPVQLLPQYPMEVIPPPISSNFTRPKRKYTKRLTKKQPKNSLSPTDTDSLPELPKPKRKYTKRQKNMGVASERTRRANTRKNKMIPNNFPFPTFQQQEQYLNFLQQMSMGKTPPNNMNIFPTTTGNYSNFYPPQMYPMFPVKHLGSSSPVVPITISNNFFPNNNNNNMNNSRMTGSCFPTSSQHRNVPPNRIPSIADLTNLTNHSISSAFVLSSGSVVTSSSETTEIFN
ncbi:hypothetical protein SNEBB_007610 [Seison nebaliae]|nr:hypothetical protein SNEBB_007610 [Seison nebaliae]